MGYKTGYNGSPVERFHKKVRRGDGCWEWIGSRSRGNGYFHLSGRIHIRAARFAYEIEYGKIPEGMCVLHRCDNPGCVRPDHLFLGTQADNVRDMAFKGRGGKLTQEKAYAVLWCAVSGDTQRSIAASYGITPRNVRAILQRKTWPSLSVSHD